MEEDKTLVTTVHATIYRGEKNADTLVFLVPISYNDMNMADCTMLLRYILPNGEGHSEELALYPLPYSTKYYQYKLGAGSRFTAVAGDIELWLTAINTNEEVVLKTSSTTVTIEGSKNIEDHLSEEDRDQLTTLELRVDALQREKADGLTYDESARKLSLTADGAQIGDAVTVPSDGYSGGGGDDPDWDPMDGNESGGDSEDGNSPDDGSKPEEDDGEGDIPWEDM